MKLEFPGVLLITGANGGLGSELVNYLLDAGFDNIACQYRSSSDVISKVFENHNIDYSKHCFYADLTVEEDVKKLRTSINESIGKVWGIINMARANSNFMSWKMSKNEFQRIVDSNLTSTFLVNKEFIPDLRDSSGGRIINISSIIAFSGIIGASHYVSSKAGLIGLTKSLALELSNKSITVNALALGYFDYGIIKDVPPAMLEEIKSKIPLKRLGKIEEIAGLLKYLLSSEGAYCTGQVFHINGGLYI